jgi:hypothetical protein
MVHELHRQVTAHGAAKMVGPEDEGRSVEFSRATRRWNIAPSQDVLVIRYNPKSQATKLGCATLGANPLLGKGSKDRLRDAQCQS